MALYTRLGAPCEIVEVRETPVWRVWRHKEGMWTIERSKPKLAKRDRITDGFDLMEFRIRRIGPYPDGSGGAEKIADAEWYETQFVIADDGWPEIQKAIDKLRSKAA